MERALFDVRRGAAVAIAYIVFSWFAMLAAVVLRTELTECQLRAVLRHNDCEVPWLIGGEDD